MKICWTVTSLIVTCQPWFLTGMCDNIKENSRPRNPITRTHLDPWISHQECRINPIYFDHQHRNTRMGEILITFSPSTMHWVTCFALWGLFSSLNVSEKNWNDASDTIIIMVILRSNNTELWNENEMNEWKKSPEKDMTKVNWSQPGSSEWSLLSPRSRK